MAPGKELRSARIAAGLSARELARRLNYSHSEVLAWERGTTTIPSAVVATILDVLRQEILARAEAERELQEFVKERRGI